MENVATPAKRALAVLDNPPQAPATDLPPRRISKKVRSAIDAMVSGECRKINEAAAKAGLARETLSRALSQAPHSRAPAPKGVALSGHPGRARWCRERRIAR
jgi:transposase-like protein